MMEEHRADLAVIAAGYPEEMKTFIDANPGLRSRFTNYIDFPDYSTPELVEIFEVMAGQAKVNLGPDVTPRLSALFAEAATGTNFGNARFARSVFEDAYANMSGRAMADGKIDKSELSDLLIADLPGDDRHQFAEHRPIGFRAPPRTASAKPGQSSAGGAGAAGGASTPMPAQPAKGATGTGAPVEPVGDPPPPAKPA